MEHNDEWYMHKALTAARWAADLDEVPVGCVIVKHDKIIAWGWNSREETQDPTGHAEIMAIRKAAEYLGSWRLDDCTMYVTLEPCCMCAGALIQSRVSRVVFGASDPKGGCVGSCLNVFSVPEFNHHPAVDSGCLQTECG
ncbi:tRNA adenosine(34) deaminase TadA, partial [Faecalibaculum rodentium]